VVGVDGSAPSDLALAWACDEADRAGAEMVIVHAWTYPYLPVDSQGSQARDLTQVDAACLLDASVQTARERVGVPVSGLLVEDTPVSALLGAVRDGDLLVLGRRGRGGLRELIIGSTTSNVMEHCVVPIANIGGVRTGQEPEQSVAATSGSAT
jgi:nucleotide-binding universal stress UspA family protein